MITGGNRSAGFTVVETLIVLAVSAILATSALLLVSGRQNKTQFLVAANNMKQQLQQVVNETRNGFYPNSGNFTCSGSGATVTISSGTNKEGTNNTCIFLGKVVVLGLGSDSDAINIYPLVAKRTVTTGGTTRDVASFTEAQPYALGPGTPRDLSTNGSTQNGLNFTFGKYTTATTTINSKKPMVLAFADDLGQYTLNSNGQLDSSVEKLNLYSYDVTPAWPGAGITTSAQVVAKINTTAAANTLASTDVVSAQVCYNSGGTQQSALYTIAGHSQLTVTLRIFSRTGCV